MHYTLDSRLINDRIQWDHSSQLAAPLKRVARESAKLHLSKAGRWPEYACSYKIQNTGHPESRLIIFEFLKTFLFNRDISKLTPKPKQLLHRGAIKVTELHQNA